MELLLVLGAIAFAIWHLVRVVQIVVHRTAETAPVAHSLDARDRSITQLAITEVMMPSSPTGPPKELVELAAQLSTRAFAEVSLTRESLMDRPVGWILSVVPEPGSSDSVMISANHETPTVVSARVYQNHQQMRLDEFSSWVDEHLSAPTSPELNDLFVQALSNDWSASLKRRQEGPVNWIDLRAEATPFVEPEAPPVVIDVLHNAHTGAEDLQAFLNAEAIDDVIAIAKLNAPAPMSLPTAVFDRTS